MLDPGAKDHLGAVHVALIILDGAQVERAMVVRVIPHVRAGAAPRVEYFVHCRGPLDRSRAREGVNLLDAVVGKGVDELSADRLRR
jgi:hypothetical protein